MLTDNEIIKALEEIKKGCWANGDFYTVIENALSLINRQKAEIERLELVAEINKRDNQRKMNERGNAVDVLWELYDEGIKKIERLEGELKTAKVEAIKEFAERLKSVVAIHNGDMWSRYEYIDNLVKEMVGDDNG